MSSSDDSFVDDWHPEQSNAGSNPLNTIEIRHIPRLFPDNVYSQASRGASPPLPTLDSFSVPQVQTVSGLFGINDLLRQARSPSSTLVQSSGFNSTRSTSPTLVPSISTSASSYFPSFGTHINFGGANEGQSFVPRTGPGLASYSDLLPQSSSINALSSTEAYPSQAAQAPTGIVQRPYPDNTDLWPAPSNFSNSIVEEFEDGSKQEHSAPLPDYSKPSTLFYDRVPTPPPPPPSHINPWDCLDALKIVALQCSPSDDGNDPPILHTNPLLHGNPRVCLNPSDFSSRLQIGLATILDLGARIFAARRKIKDRYVDKTIRIPMQLEDFIQELGESAGEGRNGAPLAEAVEDLEEYLRKAPLTKRPQAHSSEQILIAVHHLFTKAMADAGMYGRDKDEHDYDEFVLKQIEAVAGEIGKMYGMENEGTFLVGDFETVEGMLAEFDGMDVLKRRRHWLYPNSERLGEEQMGVLKVKFGVLGRAVMDIFEKRGVPWEGGSGVFWW
ncbi:hypothetical protein FKW77_008159 [Venturia effusa]|uniref:Uncharacterized protein n=1 Tax=Venturia effusa TaxID=50376 RepID=A0A517LJA1_9PEZI|nr:hypothetical protein FKW77_008159 [Venturia effusa]